jgi:hypothetical protein
LSLSQRMSRLLVVGILGNHSCIRHRRHSPSVHKYFSHLTLTTNFFYNIFLKSFTPIRSCSVFQYNYTHNLCFQAKFIFYKGLIKSCPKRHVFVTGGNI